MTIKGLILAIEQKHKDIGIVLNPPASHAQIEIFERALGFELPDDFKEFYLLCNGFDCTEDIFRMINLEEVLNDERHHGQGWFYFAEYMIYSDMWTLRKRSDGECEIVNEGETELVLTTSLQEFLERFLKGDVFESGGLYDWHDQIKLS